VRRALAILVPFVLTTILALTPSTADAPPPRASMLDRWARAALDGAETSVEDRERAMRNIEEAIRLEPADPGHWMVLGRLQEVGNHERLARESFEHAIRLAPEEPETRTRLAMAWKREWLRTLDTLALAHAIEQLDTVTHLRPYGSEGWLRLVPLRYEHGELPGAANAAANALAGRPRRAEAPLAVAYLAFRLGEIELADSLFRAAIPRLAPDLRALFDDPTRILNAPRPRDGDSADDPAQLDGAAHAAPPESAAAEEPTATAAGLALFAPLDPDPTTAANEVQLECWSRIAHAYFVFFDPLHPGLDARAETYMRYGPPRRVLRNPPGVSLIFKPNVLRTGRQDSFAGYPLDAEVWEYPELGMRILLHDRSLTGVYTQPVTREFIPGTIPDPRVLAARGDLLSIGGGASVFPTLPPRAQRLEVRGVVSRFEGARGPRLLAQVRAPGGPGDTLSARWVVIDTAGHEVTRGEQSLAVSACDPGESRLAEFDADLPAGRFDVTFSVRDAHRHRGVFRRQVAMPAPPSALALSDLVLCCGDPSQYAAQGAVRIEANMDSRVAGRAPLVAYFEIYRLATGADGMARFQYTYDVRRLADESSAKARAAAERRPPVGTWASREETQVGAMRRQFLRVATALLPAGRYRVSVHVKDLVSGGEAERGVEFVRE
jgi:cytochrome c-type biogenesis protein CcmH/NrfG